MLAFCRTQVPRPVLTNVAMALPDCSTPGLLAMIKLWLASIFNVPVWLERTENTLALEVVNPLVTRRLPPLKTNVLAIAPRLLSFEITVVPPLSETFPVKVLALPSVKVPKSDFDKPMLAEALLAITEAMVRLLPDVTEIARFPEVMPPAVRTPKPLMVDGVAVLLMSDPPDRFRVRVADVPRSTRAISVKFRPKSVVSPELVSV